MLLIRTPTKRPELPPGLIATFEILQLLLHERAFTLTAWGPFVPLSTSKATFCPSLKVRNPLASMEV